LIQSAIDALAFVVAAKDAQAVAFDAHHGSPRLDADGADDSC
jgi:hypothetical protein